MLERHEPGAAMHVPFWQVPPVHSTSAVHVPPVAFISAQVPAEQNAPSAHPSFGGRHGAPAAGKATQAASTQANPAAQLSSTVHAPVVGNGAHWASMHPTSRSLQSIEVTMAHSGDHSTR